MIKITEIIEAGGACPYQMEARTECGKRIYLRYRDGRLRWGFLDKYDIIPEKYEYSEKVGEDLDGFPDDELFKEKLKDQIIFPEGFQFKY